MTPANLDPTIAIPAAATDVTVTQMGCPATPRESSSHFAPAGYEVLGEIGRGGMGVVYKARHQSLNRLVALKVILGAGHAGADQQARFLAEASTVAQLAHPNIVQIYEVGSDHGQQFISLELVEGGSLAEKLRGEPQDPRLAVEMVLTLALAVEHAHSKGVVHRDLKPANVLLADSPEVAEGLKITDFGLAKQQSADSGLTATGAIIGTPSYMAPEQAAGRGSSVGPGADVYALGAILYEMLTGRPPFRAATVMDTIMQVMADEPVAPSRLQPKLSRDVETICLKCLAKKPEQRYLSAAALADDLGRFLNNEPISARPISSTRKLVKWSRRHPALALVIFMLAVPLPILLATMVMLWLDTRAAKQQVEIEKQEVVEAEAKTTKEREIARLYLQNALRSMDSMLERISDEKFSRIPAVQEERTAILNEAIAFYESLLRIDSVDPVVREETAQTFMRLSRISLLGGRTEQSERAAQGSVDLYQGLADEFPEQPELRHERARSLIFLGHSQVLNSKYELGLTAYRQALEIATSLSQQFAAESAYRFTAAECHRSLGFYHAGRSSLSEEHYKEGLRLADQLHRRHPLNVEYRALFTSLIGPYTQALIAADKHDEAATHVSRGFEVGKIARNDLPRTGPSRMLYDQGMTLLRLSAASLNMKQGKKGKAIELLREATVGFEKIIGNQPQSFPNRLQAVQAFASLAMALRQDGQHAESLKAMQRINELLDYMHRDFPVLRDPLRSEWFHQQRWGAKLNLLLGLRFTDDMVAMRTFLNTTAQRHYYVDGCSFMTGQIGRHRGCLSLPDLSQTLQIKRTDVSKSS